MAPRVLLYPKGPMSRWNSIWKALVAFYPWVHRTVRCTPDTARCNDYRSLTCSFSLLGGTRPSGRWHRTVRCTCWPLAPANMSSRRWPAGTSDCSTLRVDCPVNYSRGSLLGVCFVAEDPKEREHLRKIFSGASTEVIT
jgi:hypothetical protein